MASVVDEILKELEQEQSLPLRPSRGVPPSQRKSPVRSRSIVDELDEEIKTEPPTISQADVIAREIDTDPESLRARTAAGEDLTDAQRKIVFEAERARPLSDMAIGAVKAFVPAAAGMAVQLGKGTVKGTYQGVIKPLAQVAASGLINEPGSAEQEKAIGDAIKGSTGTVRSLASGVAQDINETANSAFRFANFGTSITDLGLEALGMMSKEKSYENYLARLQMRKLEQQDIQDRPDRAAAALQDNPLAGVAINAAASLSGMQPMTADEQAAALRGYKDSLQPETQRKPDEDISAVGEVISPVSLPARLIDPAMGVVGKTLDKTAGTALRMATKPVIKGLHPVEATGLALRKIGDKSNDLGKRFSDAITGREDSFLRTPTDVVAAFTRKPGELLQGTGRFMRDMGRQIDAGGVRGRRGIIERMGQDTASGDWVKNTFGTGSQARLEKIARDNAKRIELGKPEIKLGTGGIARAKVADYGLRSLYTGSKSGTVGAMLNGILGAADSETAEEFGNQMGVGFGIGTYGTMNLAGKTQALIDPRLSTKQKIDAVVGINAEERFADEEADLKRFRATAKPDVTQAIDRLTSPEEHIAFGERQLERAKAARAQAISEGKDAKDWDLVIATGEATVASLRDNLAKSPLTPEQRQGLRRGVELIFSDFLDQAHSTGSAAGLDNIQVSVLDTTQYEALLRERWGDTLKAAESVLSTLGPLPSHSPSEEESLRKATEAVNAFKQDLADWTGVRGVAVSPRKEAQRALHLQRVGVTSPEIVLNLDKLLRDMTSTDQDFAGRRGLRHDLLHEGMHVLEDFEEVAEMVQPTKELAFGKKVMRPDGSVEVISPGMFTDEWLDNEGVERYGGFGRTGAARAAAVDYFRNRFSSDEQRREYIRKEVLAELASVSEDGYGSVRDGLDSIGQTIIDRVLIANKNSMLGRLRAGLELAGITFDSRNNPKSILFGKAFTPQLLAAMREYKRRLRDFEGTLSYSRSSTDPDIEISLTELLANRAFQEAYKDDVIWEKDTTVSVFDDAGKLIAEIPITDSVGANAAMAEYRVKNGQLVDEKGTPLGILQEVDFSAFPDGSHVNVDSKIRRNADGSPIILQRKEIERRSIERDKMIKDALDNAPDDGSGIRLSDTGNGSYRGSMSSTQMAAILALPNSIVPPSLKRNIIAFNELLQRKDGTRVLVEYQPALLGRKYRALSPKIRDLVPIGFQFTKKGNFLAVTISVSRMFDKMNAWAKQKPDNLNLWGRDTGRFWDDVMKVMSNHQKGLHADGTDTNGNLVGDPLDPNPEIALNKKNRINDFFNLFNKATENLNPDRTKLPVKRGKDSADRIIMSARMDRITQLQVSNATKLPVDYGKITTNFFPDPNEDSDEDPVAIAFSGDTVVQRGGSDEDRSSIYVVRNNQRVASGYYDRMARDFFFGKEQKSFQTADEAAQYFDAVAGSDPTSENPDNFFPGMHYRDVPSDPKVALADFYMLGMLMKVPTTGWSMDARDKIVGAHGESGVMRHIPRDATGRLAGARLDWFTDAIDEAKEVAIPIMRKRMSDAVWFSVSAELRHFFQRPQDRKLMNLPIAQELARALALQTSRPTGVILPEPREQYKMNSSDRVNANAAFNDARKRGGYTRRDVALFAERAFREGKWASSYGGPKWGDIAAHLAHLEDESIMGETIKTWRDGKFIDTGILSDRAYENMAVAIDRAYDLQHNTGGVLNKLKTYADSSGSYGWIQQMLDFKAAVVNPRELMHMVSPTMRRIATAVFGDTRASNPTLEDAKNDLLKYVIETTASKTGKNAAPYRKMSTDFVESLVAEAKSMVERSGEDSVIKVYKWLKGNYPTPHRELIAKIPVFKKLVDDEGTSAINKNSGMHLRATTLTLLDKAFPGMSDKLLEKRFWAFDGDALQLMRMAIVEVVIEKNSIKIKAEAQRIAAKKAADEAAKKKAEEAKLAVALKAEALKKAASNVGSSVIITPDMLHEAMAAAKGIKKFKGFGARDSHNHEYFQVDGSSITHPGADYMGEPINGTFEDIVNFWVKEGVDKDEAVKALLLFDKVNPGAPYLGTAIDEHISKQNGLEKAIDKLLVDDPHTDEHGNVWNLESLESDIESVTMVELNLNGAPITNAFPLDSETMLPPESDVLPAKSLVRYFKEQIYPDWFQHLKVPTNANANDLKEVTPEMLAATIETILAHTGASKSIQDISIDNLTNKELEHVIDALNALLPASQKVKLDSAAGFGGFDFIQFIGADGTKVSVETIPADNAGGKVGVIDSNGIQSIFKFPLGATANQKFIAGILAANGMSIGWADKVAKQADVTPSFTDAATTLAAGHSPGAVSTTFPWSTPIGVLNLSWSKKGGSKIILDPPKGSMPLVRTISATPIESGFDFQATNAIESLYWEYVDLYGNPKSDADPLYDFSKQVESLKTTGKAKLDVQTSYGMKPVDLATQEVGSTSNIKILANNPDGTPIESVMVNVGTTVSQNPENDVKQAVSKAIKKLHDKVVAELEKSKPAAVKPGTVPKPKKIFWNTNALNLKDTVVNALVSGMDVDAFGLMFGINTPDGLTIQKADTGEAVFQVSLDILEGADSIQVHDTINDWVVDEIEAHGQQPEPVVTKDGDGGLNTDPLQAMPAKEEDLSRAITPTTLYNFYHIATLESQGRLKSDYAQGVVKEYLDIYKRRYVDAFTKMVEEQIAKYIGRRRTDPGITMETLEAAKGDPAALDGLMQKTFRSDMKRRNDVWNFVTEYLRGLHEAKSTKDIIFFIDRLNNAVHNTNELLFSKFRNAGDLLETFDTIHRARDERAYGRNVDKTLRELEDFDKGPTDQFMPSSQELFKGDMLGQREFFKEKLVDSEYDNMREVPHDILQEWSDEWRKGHPRDGSATDGVAFMPSADSNWWVLNRQKQVLWGPMPKAEAENFAPNYLLTDKRPAENDFTWKLYEPASDDPEAQGIVQAAHQAGMRLFGKDRSGYVRGLDKFSEESADQLPIGEYFPTMSHAFDPANANGAHDISDQEITSKKLEEIQAEDGNIYIASSDGITRYLADQFMPNADRLEELLDFTLKPTKYPDGDVWFDAVGKDGKRLRVTDQFGIDGTYTDGGMGYGDPEKARKIISAQITSDFKDVERSRQQKPKKKTKARNVKDVKKLEDIWEGELTDAPESKKPFAKAKLRKLAYRNSDPGKWALDLFSGMSPKLSNRLEKYTKQSLGEPMLLARISDHVPTRKVFGQDMVGETFTLTPGATSFTAFPITSPESLDSFKNTLWGTAEKPATVFIVKASEGLAAKSIAELINEENEYDQDYLEDWQKYAEEEEVLLSGQFKVLDVKDSGNDRIVLLQQRPRNTATKNLADHFMPDIANQPELESKLSAFLATRRVADKRIKDWFSNHYVKGFLQASQAEGSRMAELKSYKPKKSDPDWKHKSGLQQFLGLSDSERQWIAHATDYMATLPDQELDKLNKQPLSEMQRKVTEWDKKLQKNMGAKAQAVKENTDIKTIARISEEFSIVELVSKKAYEDEGKIMGHCVGENYDPKDKDVRLLSLRGKDQQPHVTLEVVKDLDSWIDSQREIAAEDLMGEMDEEEDYDNAKDTAWELSLKYVLDEYDLKEKELDRLQKRYRGFIVQIKGKGNKAPIEKYAKVVREFLKQNSGQYLILKEGENIGLKNKSGKADALEEAEPDEEPLKSKYKKPVKTRTLEELLDFKLKKERLQGFGGERYFDQYAVTNEGEPIINPDGMPYSSTTWGYNLTEEKARKHIAAWIRSDFKKKANRNLSSWEGKQTDQMMPSAPYASNAGNSGTSPLSDVIPSPVSSARPVSAAGPLASVRSRVNLGESKPSDKILPLDKVSIKSDQPDQFMPAGKNPRYTGKDGQFDWKLYSEDRKKAIAYLRDVRGITRKDVNDEEEWKELIRQTMRGK
jgi:hypothetical protein